MKKTMILACCLTAMFTLSVPTLADDSHSQGAAAEKKSSRKKRQLMCKDCGKPEVKCDCPEEVKAKERAEAAKKKAEGHEE